MDVVHVGRTGEVFNAFPEHQHGYWEIIYNRQGTGTMTVEGKIYGFGPGDIVIVPPETLHRKESAEGFSDICMFINNFRPIGRDAFRILRDDDKGTVGGLMEMATRFSRDKGIYEQAILNVIGDLVYQVCVLFYINNQEKDLRLEGIMELMQKNLDNPDFDLSEAIEKGGYCKGYFRRIFKEFTGQSPVNYFQKMRINYAKSLMNQYGASREVKDIASASGFRDPLYFSRVFKKIEGICPKEYMWRQRQHDAALIVMDTPKEFLRSQKYLGCRDK